MDAPKLREEMQQVHNLEQTSYILNALKTKFEKCTHFALTFALSVRNLADIGLGTGCVAYIVKTLVILQRQSVSPGHVEKAIPSFSMV